MKTSEKSNVGAGPVSARGKRGITLVALIITIIVMLILVGVSLQVVINSNLIGTAQDAANSTETQYLEEGKLGSIIEIEGKKYLSMEDYVAGIERAPDIMEGEGTEANPYTIDSIEALVQFAHSVTNGKTYEGEYVKLTSDLDFKSSESYLDATRTDYEEYGYTGSLMTALTTGEGWKPIGNGVESTGNIFAGTFDGNGKIINNLRINKQDNIISDIGLFSDNLGIIKNLCISNCDIDINVSRKADIAINCGSACGYSYGLIDNCWVSGSLEINTSLVENTIRVAGVCGAANSCFTSATINKCYSEMNINLVGEGDGSARSVRAVGGILGASTKGVVTNCYNLGNINATMPNAGIGNAIGGIIGFSVDSVTDCYNVGDLKGSSLTGACRVGGIVGNGATLAENCYNIGSIESSNTSGEPSAGGIVGAAGTVISKCYNFGAVIGKTSSGTPAVGGICGSDAYDVDYCCNVGEISYEGDSTKYVGAVVGKIRKTMSNSYFLNNTTLNGIARNYSGTAQPTRVETIEEMPAVLEIIGEGFKSDTKNINGGYPILNWQ